MGRQDDDGGTEAMPGREIALAAAEAAKRLAAEPLAPGLYLIATPIGNLGDITLRALAVLARADVIYCEDTRHSRTLLAHFAIKRRLEPYHEHNAEEQRPRILEALRAGKRVALISDAGTPLVSDPGFKLVRDAAEAGHAVTSLPGASAVLAALSSSGLPTDSFFFAGFLPPRSKARQARLEELAAIPATLVLFEAQQRAAVTLADMASLLGNRKGVVARELTKLYEEIARGTLTELADRFREREVRGEIVILSGPPLAVAVSDETINARLAEALAAMSLRDAAKSVADALGVPKARVYELGLALKRGRS